MNRYRIIFGITAVILCSAVAAFASPVTYEVVVDTTSVSGDSGSLDFQFNGQLGGTSQAASLDVSDFSSDGTLIGPPVLTSPPDVTGDLLAPGTVTFQNATVFDDYFEDFTYGSTLSFLVSLYGPALASPDGMSTAGSIFGFSMFSDPLGVDPILTTDPSGFATTIAVNLDGTTTVADNSAETTVTPVPEPTTFVLAGSGMLGLWTRRRRR